MEIRTDITLDDYKNFNLFVAKRISAEKPLKLLSNIFGVLYWALAAIIIMAFFSFYTNVPWGTYKQIDTATIALISLVAIPYVYSKWFKTYT